MEISDINFNDCLKIDFSTWKRCRVISKEILSTKFVKLNLKLDNYDMITDHVLLGFPWNQVNIQPNNIISIMGKYDDEQKLFMLSSDFGLLIVNPDYLISSTKISQSLFCQRKAVLSEKFQLESTGSLQMVLGILVHDLFQKALSSTLENRIQPDIVRMCNEVLNSRDLAFKCYENFLSINMVKKPLQDFMLKIKEFLAVSIKKPLQQNQNMEQDKTIKIDKIYDIEENVWSPQLGLKGKVDVTVHIHGRKNKNVIPFELKTGRASMEHRAQIILYGAMMKQIGCDVNSGILYYLQENEITEIDVKHNELRDLIVSRNELVYYLVSYENEPIDPENLESQKYNLMKLPDPISRQSVCEKCDYQFICATYYNNSANNNKSHPIQKIGEDVLRHLSEDDLKYFFKWSEILHKEEEALSQDQNTSELWTKSPWQRFESGKALIDLTLVKVVKCIDGNVLHSFKSTLEHSIDHVSFEVGQYVIVSTSERFAVSTGILSRFEEDHIEVSLDRELRSTLSDAKFILDKYSSKNFLSLCFGNLALLMQNRPQSNHLRNIIVKKLQSEVSHGIGQLISQPKKLNESQQMIVSNAVNCKNYLLIRGYAGTGKTETIVALINELYQRGKSVIITSQTHSAIDNILLRVKKIGLKFLRVGKLARIMPELHEFSEHILTKDCKTPSDFESVYAQYQIVAATSYGVVHPLFSRRLFEVCIVDEATQLTQPLILRSLLCAKKFVLIGDPHQLPPVIKSNYAKSLGGDESLFCWLDSNNENPKNEMICQYRMNLKICKLANSFTYANRLINCKKHPVTNFGQEFVQYTWEKRIFSSSLGESTLFLNTGSAYERNMQLVKSEEFSEHMTKLSKIGHKIENTKKIYINLLEALLVTHLIIKLLKCNIKVEDIGVIATYRSQVDCIKNMVRKLKECKNVEINTVDQYQGRDKLIIIYSCTKTTPMSLKKESKLDTNEILDDNRRLTVAITRPKSKLVIIGDYTSIEENLPFKKLFECMSTDIINISESFYDLEWEHFLKDLSIVM